MAQASDPERCSCGELAQRVFCAPLISGTKAFEAEYYHSLGKVITNKRELNNELAKRDLVPIGNDWGSGNKMVDHADASREEAREKKWDKVLESIQL
jgi:hypothetical protein